MKSASYLFLVVLVLFAAGCTAGPNEMQHIPNASGEVAGFLMGLWHGFIALFTWVASLFLDNISVYEVHNNGGWYNFGFLLGVGAFSGGAASAK